jgi:undecaprenyl diphosphate synthase
MSFLKTKESGEAQVDFDRLPRHVAIIMDGNGRWAKRRGLPRTAGHAAGAETFRSIATYCQKIGLEYLTVYAFSTENWKRPLEEVSAIVGLLKKYLLESIEKMEKDKIKLHFFGDLEPLPQELKDMCRKTSEISERYEGMQVNVCFNYGGRDEIVRAARHFAADCAAGRECFFHSPPFWQCAESYLLKSGAEAQRAACVPLYSTQAKNANHACRL